MAADENTIPPKDNEIDQEALKELEEDVKRVEQQKAELAQQQAELAKQKAELEQEKVAAKQRKAAEKAEAKKKKAAEKKRKAEEKRLQEEADRQTKEAERQAKEDAAIEKAVAKEQAKIKLPEYYTNPSSNDRDRRLQLDLAFSWHCGMAGEKVTYSAQITYLGPRRKASRVAFKGIIGRPAKRGRWYIERTPIYFFRGHKKPHLIKDPEFILEALQHPKMWRVEFIKDQPKAKDEAVAQKLLDNRIRHLDKPFKKRRDLILLNKIKAPLRQGEAEQVLQFAQTNKFTLSDEIKAYLNDKIKEYTK